MDADSFTRGDLRSWRALIFFLVTIWMSGCGGGNPCGCGASTDAPLSQHDLSFAGNHTVDAQCVCRCGEGSEVSFRADRPCGDYETRCEEPSGQRSRYRCD